MPNNCAQQWLKVLNGTIFLQMVEKEIFWSGILSAEVTNAPSPSPFTTRAESLTSTSESGRTERFLSASSRTLNRWVTCTMECYAPPWRLWRESRNFIDFTEPSYPEKAPLSFSCRELFSFCHFNRVRAYLQAQRLAHGTGMSAGTWVKLKKLLKMLCELSLLTNKRRVWKNNSFKLEKIPFMKNYGLTLIKGNYTTSGWQRGLCNYFLESGAFFLVFWKGVDSKRMDPKTGCGESIEDLQTFGFRGFGFRGFVFWLKGFSGVFNLLN